MGLETEVQNQGVSMAVFPLKSPGEDASCLFHLLVAPGVPWLLATSLQSLPLSSHSVSLCVSLCVFSSSYKDISYWI